MKKLLIMTTALIITSPAYAVDDGFGARFGNSTPYALDNSMTNAIADTKGMEMDDLNDAAGLNALNPAAGEETAVEIEAEVEAEAETDAATEVEIQVEGDAPATVDANFDGQTDAGIDANAGAEEAVIEVNTEVETEIDAEVTTATEPAPSEEAPPVVVNDDESAPAQ